MDYSAIYDNDFPFNSQILWKDLKMLITVYYKFKIWLLSLTVVFFTTIRTII